MKKTEQTNRTTKTRYPGEELRCWNLQGRKQYFTGREDLLIQLQQKLFPPNARILLSGLAGSGKTELAREYAYQNYDRYSHIFRLDIETTEYQQQLEDIITELEIDQEDNQECEDAFISWLRQQKGWLLILDGYQNSKKINKFWHLKGKLLVTASIKITDGDFRPEDVIEVKSLESQEAVDFLKKQTLPADYKVTPAMEKAIQSLAATLGGLPQALLATSRDIRKPKVGPRDYDECRQRYAEQIQALRQQTNANQVQRTTLGIPYSWWHSFKEVERQSQEAAIILQCCAMLDSPTIYIEIIENLPSLNLRGSQLATKIKPLLDYFLIYRQNYTFLIESHITHFFQYWLDNNAKKNLSIAVIQALSKTLESTTIPHLRRAQIYTTYFDTCEELIQKHGIEQSKVADLYDSYGRYLVECAEYKEAGDLLEESWKMRQQFNIEDLQGLKKATNRSHKAELLYTQGKYSEAKRLLETEVLPVRERVLGQCDISVATTYYHLARLASILDKTRIEFYELCLKLATIWSQMSISTLSKSNAIILLKQQGSIYYMQRRYEKSIEKYDEAITIATEALEDLQIQGLEKNTLRIEIEICEVRKGRCYVALRKVHLYKKAENQYRLLLRIYTETFQINHHPEIAQTYLGLAELYKIQNERDLAKDYYNKANDIYKRIQKDHPQIAQIYINLAAIYKRQGKYHLAKGCYNDAIDIYKRIQQDHPLIKDIQELIKKLPIR